MDYNPPGSTDEAMIPPTKDVLSRERTACHVRERSLVISFLFSMVYTTVTMTYPMPYMPAPGGRGLLVVESGWLSGLWKTILAGLRYSNRLACTYVRLKMPAARVRHGDHR